MNILSIEEYQQNEPLPGTLRIDYQSAVDGLRDWALLRSGANSHAWIIMIHGHGAHADQLFARRDIREAWLPRFESSGAGILSINLRNNAWMSPAAAIDLNNLLRWMREEYGLKQTLFWSGSMGGTSNLIYAALHPQDVDALVSLGAATDIVSYYQWCCEHQQEKQVLKEIANAIETAYGKGNTTLRQHSALHNVGRLTMPIYLAHGANDATIPVVQARQFAEAMSAQKYFYYHEIPGGNHDSPLWDANAWEFVQKVWAKSTFTKHQN